jgi:hypothetical protein
VVKLEFEMGACVLTGGVAVDAEWLLRVARGLGWSRSRIDLPLCGIG